MAQKLPCKRELKVATYNVHMWSDGDGVSNVQRVADLVRQLQPDVLCLQEADDFCGSSMSKFCRIMEYSHFWITPGSVAIFTNLDTQEENSAPLQHSKKMPCFQEPRFVTSHIKFTDNVDFYISCLHLNHELETIRLNEITKMESSLKTLFDKNAAQMWVGDFNAVTRTDYREEEWTDIARVRQQGDWEAPVSQLTDHITGKLGFTDNWSRQGRPPPTSTCRFNTHIDYVYTNKTFDSMMTCTDVIHHPGTASDHKLVMATFVLTN